jgi:aminocarboxymuconate-semialdehyde decarboxylase
MTQQKETLIDTHAHIVPESLVEEARNSGASLGVSVEDTDRGPALQFDGLTHLRPVGGLADMGPRLEWMDRQGLELQILASWLDIQGYTLSADNAATWARLFNQHLSQVIESHPNRFRGLATVPIQDGEMAARELDYSVNQLGFLGAMLATDPVEQDLSRDSFDPLWSAAEELDVPLVLHPPTHGFGANIRPGYLAFSLGRTLDTTITTAKLILTGLLDRHPRLKLVLVHGGGYLPYQAARIDNGYRGGNGRPVELQREKPSDYLPMLYYDNVAVSTPAVRMMNEIAGPEHLLLGSDYVFAGSPAPIASNIEAAGFTPDQLNLICCGNARRLFLKEE